MSSRGGKLAPEVNRGVVRPLWKIRPNSVWLHPTPQRPQRPQPRRVDPVHDSILTILYSQVRQGIANNTKGTAFVVYEDVMDAKQACDKLNGFNFQNRYLVGS
ncbi:hypothetical protein AUP68_12677 [Ilyonectria robusta]